MTEDEAEMLRQRVLGGRRKRKDAPQEKYAGRETDLQKACVGWFRRQYPDIAASLIHVPNEGKRSVATAGILKSMGMIPGVSDLILLEGNRYYTALCVEMKNARGRQNPAQKVWGEYIRTRGAKYVVCCSLSQFMNEVKDYLKNQMYGRYEEMQPVR